MKFCIKSCTQQRYLEIRLLQYILYLLFDLDLRQFQVQPVRYMEIPDRRCLRSNLWLQICQPFHVHLVRQACLELLEALVALQ